MKEQGIKLKRRKGYTAAPNTVIADTRISPEARLMLIYMMSCSEDWVFYQSKSMEVLCCGRDKYQRVIRELKKFGYLIVKVKQGSRGRLDGQEWEIVDDPETQDTCEQDKNTAQGGVNGASDREPENPVAGDTQHREPENPVHGEDVPGTVLTGSRFTPPTGKLSPERSWSTKALQT